MDRKFYLFFLLILLPTLLPAQNLLLSETMVISIAPDPKAAAKSASPKTISVADVSKNIGMRVSVCGKVFNAKKLKMEEGNLVVLKMGSEYLNERIDIQVRFDESSSMDVDLQKLLLQKHVCLNGTVIDAFGITEIYIDTLNARRLIEESQNAVPEIDVVKLEGNSLKLLANAYVLEGPKWKNPVVTHLKEGSIVKVEKVQPGWVYAKVMVKNGNLIDGDGIYGFISYQALGLTRKCQIESAGKIARN